MKKILVFYVTLFFIQNCISQGISIGQISQNLSIIPLTIKKDLHSIDSTFVYAIDTITLPFFDDFSSDKFQTYSPNFNDPSTTSQLYYRLKDAATNVVLNNDALFTNQVTFRRIYNATTSTTNDIPFSDTLIKVGNLMQYPVAYNTLSLYPPYYI